MRRCGPTPVEDVGHAYEVLARLPLVQAKLIAFECLALAAFMGFDALLAASLEDLPYVLPDPTCGQTHAEAGP